MKESPFDVSYLSIDSIQEGVGSSQITPLVMGLSASGKKVCLITFEKVRPSVDLLEQFRNLGITWRPREFGKGGALAGMMRLNELRRNIPNSRVLHGRSDIPTAAAIWSGVDAPVLWDVRSLWSDQRQFIGTSGWNRVTARGARTLENASAKRAIAMTTLTAAVVPILEARHSRLPKIREVIPTCVQTSKFLPSPMRSGQTICLLSGTFNNYYDLDRTREIIKAIRKSVDLKVIWARAGESPELTLGVGEDEVISATHSEMPDLVRKAHFGMAICKEDQPDSLAAAVPTKIGEFLASGRPVIVSKGIGDMDAMLEDSRTGLIVSHSADLDNVGTQVQELIADQDIQDRCREIALKYFDMDKAIVKYSQVYEKMQEES